MEIKKIKRMKKLFLVVVVVTLLVGCKAKKNYTTWENAYEKVENTETKGTDIATEKKGSENRNVNETYTANNSSLRREEVKLTQGVELKKFCVIVGSFANIDNAISLMNTLKGMGRTTCSIMENAQGMNRVSIMSFDTESEARGELARVRENTDFKDAWLLMSQF